MLHILKNIFIGFLSCLIATGMILSTVVFGDTPEVFERNTGKNEPITKYYLGEIKNQNQDNLEQLEKKNINIGSPLNFTKDQTLFVEFGRLATAFIGASSGVLTPEMLTVSGHILQFSGEYPVLTSLYDPFTNNYVLTTKDANFSIEQITNGSFYFGKEQDGTISIYSIDAVGRLNFLHNGIKQTDMVIFPGMYVRFDPVLNPGLKDADLFRILLSMGPSGTDRAQLGKDSVGVTGVEFVNLRMDDTNDRDTFFMYRLPKETRVLFRMLHILFHDRVAQVDILKKYATNTSYISTEELSAWIKNPSKRNYYLFQELEKTLSDGIQFPTKKDEFSQKIQKIHQQAQSFMVGNSINATLEQFLTDSRFALFSTNNSSKKYEDIYNEVATILGIKKTSGKYQFFQKLSDIYSQNIVTQKRDTAFSKIDTYTPTAAELLSSVNFPDIEQKDYFDIALYSYNVLKKAEDRGIFLKDAVYSTATYQLLNVFFEATDKYARESSQEKRVATYKSIAIQFYDHLLSVLVKSVYLTFTETKDGYIYLKEGVMIKDGKVKYDTIDIPTLRSLDARILSALETLQYIYKDDSDISTFLNIKTSILQFHGFTLLFKDKAYTNYILTPYKASTGSDIGLPQVLPDYSGLIEEAPPIKEAPVITQVVIDPTIQKIQNILGKTTNASVILDSGYYRVSNGSMTFINPRDQLPQIYKFALLFSRDTTTFQDFYIGYSNYSIQVNYSTPQQTESLQALFQAVPNYITHIESVLSNNPALKGEIQLFPERGLMIIGGNMKFNL